MKFHLNDEFKFSSSRQACYLLFFTPFNGMHAPRIYFYLAHFIVCSKVNAAELIKLNETSKSLSTKVNTQRDLVGARAFFCCIL